MSFDHILLAKINALEKKLNEGGGGASSWNDLKDKPFYSEMAEGVVTFDGILTGKEWIGEEDSGAVKVSDKILSAQDIVGATWIAYDRGKKYSGIFSDDDVDDAVADMLENGEQLPVENPVFITAQCHLTSFVTVGIFVCRNVESLIEMPDGIWFGFTDDYMSDAYVASISCLTDKVETVKTIDKKYLPEPLQFGTEVTEGVAAFDGDLTGKEYIEAGDEIYLVKMSDDALTVEQLIGSTIIMKHSVYQDEPFEFVITEDKIAKEELDESNYMTMVGDPDTDIPSVYVICGDLSSIGVPVPQGTYYVLQDFGEGEHIYTESLSCLSGMREIVRKIDEKYLPAVGLKAEEVKAMIDEAMEETASEMINNAIGAAIGGGY